MYINTDNKINKIIIIIFLLITFFKTKKKCINKKYTK